MAKGWTQQQLADVMGTSRGTVAQWENGLRQPTVASLKRLGEALEIDWTTLA